MLLKYKFHILRLKLIHIRGKRGRTVPLIITPEMDQALNVLTDAAIRNKADIHEENLYVFPLAKGSLNNIRGWDALYATVQLVDLSEPESFKSTALRRYVATVSQILNMGDNELDWLATHLGHDIKVHRNFYRLREEQIELAKVAKLLITVDRGDLHKHAGKKLSEIELGGTLNCT